MTSFLALILGMLIGFFIIIISKSIYIPKTMWIQGIKLFGKPYTFIENVEGKIFYKGNTIEGGSSKWDLIDDIDNKKDASKNIYFFLWPFFTVHVYEISYTKVLKLGEEKSDDIILRTKYDSDGEIIENLVLRKRKTNHLLYRQSYPMYTTGLSTEELANINTVTEPILEIVNPSKALYGVADWLKSSISILNAALRGFVATKSLDKLNHLSSEGGSETFNKAIKDDVDIYDDIHPGLPNIGVRLFKYAFEDYDPADEESKKLMSSFTNVVIAEEEAKAEIKKAEGEATAKMKRADGNAYSTETEKSAEVKMEKKRLVDTGHAKIDNSGNITELVPDANVKVGAEAIKELSKLTGSLVLDSNSITKIFNVNPEKKEV